MKRILLTAAVALLSAFSTQADKIKVLLIDGQNNHKWKETSPILVDYLKESGVFSVEVATSPPKGGDMSTFKPEFSKFDVVVSNYNGQMWSESTQKALETFVKNGGGFVSVHAANNSFSKWKEYNRMIGVGGWGGRNEKDGPYVRYWKDKVIRVTDPGRGGAHGQQHEFVVDVRDSNHPITKGLPKKWLHAKDELYDRLRGPAENLHVLATAYADPKTRGSGHNEPMLMTIDYGKGRVFHTTLGHYVEAMKCVGFQTTFLRGTEWAATGKVTQEIPTNFPTAEKLSSN